VPHKDACLLSDEQVQQTLVFCFPEALFHNKELDIGEDGYGEKLKESQKKTTCCFPKES